MIIGDKREIIGVDVFLSMNDISLRMATEHSNIYLVKHRLHLDPWVVYIMYLMLFLKGGKLFQFIQDFPHWPYNHQ